MKNLLYIHDWDSQQWDFLFLTDGRIFSQKEFFVHYARIYLEYSIKKIYSSIRMLEDTTCIPWEFQKIIPPNIQAIFSTYPPESEFLLIYDNALPDLWEVTSYNIILHQINESNFLAQIEPEWRNLNKVIQENSNKVILLYLWISRFNIAKRLIDYKRDFIDTSYLHKKISVKDGNNWHKKIKQILLQLHLYTFAVKIYHTIWKILRK